jgi:hypothetical protein
MGVLGENLVFSNVGTWSDEYFPRQTNMSVVYVIYSSGIRLGTWEYLRWKDMEAIIGPQTLGNIEIAYKINTVCELLYGFSTGEYPNGEKMSTLKMAELIKKYPDEFAPWKATLENNETATEFFGHRLPDDFVDVLTDITMKESSINPDLKPIMRSAFTLQKNQIMLETFEQYDCQSYYDTKVPH